MRIPTESTPTNSSQRHILPLDGLRGIAVLAVMVFHFGLFGSQLNLKNPLEYAAGSLFNVGWTGVDLFFVLSGFLITGILIDSLGAENYLRAFYMRRVLRIFPLYYFSLALYWIAMPEVSHAFQSWIGGTPEPWFRGWGFALRLQHLLYLQNWPPFVHQNLLNVRIPYTMTHYWSVAVEEQYYLIWPWIVMLLSRKRLIQVIWTGCIVVLILRVGLYAAGVEAEMIYRNTFTRLDGLLIGGGCAIGMREGSWRTYCKKHTGWLPLLPLLLLPICASRVPSVRLRLSWSPSVIH